MTKIQKQTLENDDKTVTKMKNKLKMMKIKLKIMKIELKMLKND